APCSYQRLPPLAPEVSELTHDLSEGGLGPHRGDDRRHHVLTTRRGFPDCFDRFVDRGALASPPHGVETAKLVVMDLGTEALELDGRLDGVATAIDVVGDDVALSALPLSQPSQVVV